MHFEKYSSFPLVFQVSNSGTLLNFITEKTHDTDSRVYFLLLDVAFIQPHQHHGYDLTLF